MKTRNMEKGPIGVFDSGYGGLTILEEFRRQLPKESFLYLGDNARTPYGTRSFEVVYQFTREAVMHLFKKGCPLVILACNTASAKALRNIQQKDLPKIAPEKRVLGIIRPTSEILGDLTQSRHVGILATAGTVRSGSYPIEIRKLFPDITVTQVACPMWVPLVENGEGESEGADYFIKKYIDELFKKDPKTDTVILGCTHYPILRKKIQACMPEGVRLVFQGPIVSESLKDYLIRHPEMDRLIQKDGQTKYLTTESTETFEKNASIFLKEPVMAQHIEL